ncbi:MAG: hypothetical protein KAH56_04020 [Candidatus Krumholzibacteria bacterium]|nr:hypothetical protein [Candidatus Krumholzibacteria bacterium]
MYLRGEFVLGVFLALAFATGCSDDDPSLVSPEPQTIELNVVADYGLLVDWELVAGSVTLPSQGAEVANAYIRWRGQSGLGRVVCTESQGSGTYGYTLSAKVQAPEYGGHWWALQSLTTDGAVAVDVPLGWHSTTFMPEPSWSEFFGETIEVELRINSLVLRIDCEWVEESSCTISGASLLLDYAE